MSTTDEDSGSYSAAFLWAFCDRCRSHFMASKLWNAVHSATRCGRCARGGESE